MGLARRTAGFGITTSSRSGGGGSGVSSFNTRTGVVTAQAGDYTAAQVTNAADKASGSTQVFASRVEVAASGGFPAFVVADLSGALNAKKTWITANGGVAAIQALNDAENSGRTALQWPLSLSSAPVTIPDGVITSALQVTTGAAANKYLGSDASGNAAWATILASQVTNAADKASGAQQTFLADVSSSRAGASLVVNDPTAGVDQKTARLQSSSGTAQIQAANDAYSAARTALSFPISQSSVPVTMQDGAIVPSLRVTTSPAAGKVLTSDASGNATWQTAPTGNIASTYTSGQTSYYVNAMMAMMSAVNTTTGTPVANEVIASPLLILSTTTFDQVASQVQTAAAAGGIVRVGIYNDNGGKPAGASLIKEFGTLPTTSTTTQTLAISPSLVLQPGLYWVVQKYEVAMPTCYIISGCTQTPLSPMNSVTTISGAFVANTAPQSTASFFDSSASAGALAATFASTFGRGGVGGGHAPTSIGLRVV